VASICFFFSYVAVWFKNKEMSKTFGEQKENHKWNFVAYINVVFLDASGIVYV